jgi:hypothetical protein
MVHRRRPAFENDAAGLIQHQDQIGPAERARLRQFERERLGLAHGGLGTREAASAFVGMHLRSVKDMKKISHRMSIIRNVRNSSENRVMKCTCRNLTSIGMRAADLPTRSGRGDFRSAAKVFTR